MPQLPTNLSAERNKGHIVPIIERFTPENARILEIASGTGQHGHYFCGRNPGVIWQPTDLDSDNLDGINAWRKDLGQENFLPPISLDCRTGKDLDWEPFNLIVNINMIHISPWETTEGLMALANKMLSKEGILYLYGPYIEEDKPTTESNLEFDQWLKSKDPRYGIRSLKDVQNIAAKFGLHLTERVEMPANNLSIILQKG